MTSVSILTSKSEIKKHNSFVFEDRSVKLCTVIGLVIPFKYLTLIFDISFHIDLRLEGQKFKITINQSLLKLEPWIFYDNMSSHSLGSQYNFDLSLVFDLNLGIMTAGPLSHLTCYDYFDYYDFLSTFITSITFCLFDLYGH